RPAATAPAPVLQPVRSRVDPERQQELRQDLVAWVKEQSRDWGKPGYEPVYPDLPEEPAPREYPPAWDNRPAWEDQPENRFPVLPGTWTAARGTARESGSPHNPLDEPRASEQWPAGAVDPPAPAE